MQGERWRSGAWWWANATISLNGDVQRAFPGCGGWRFLRWGLRGSGGSGRVVHSRLKFYFLLYILEWGRRQVIMTKLHIGRKGGRLWA
jgi:hypothetical protein